MRALLLAALLAAPASAETSAVLSSESKPYREALEGMREALGPDAPPTLSAIDEDATADTVVAFGAKAALARRSGARTLIVALAPAYVPHRQEAACVVVISAMPAPEAMVAALLRLQPELPRIWVPWVSPPFESYMKALVKAGLASGVIIKAVRLEKTEDLPAQLRAADMEMTAILVPPDPELVNRSTFDMLKQAARAHNAPIYAPFPNLVSEGATASIGVSFREMGRAAGAAARTAAAGLGCGSMSYPGRVEIRVSLSAALKADLKGDRAYYAGFAEVVP